MMESRFDTISPPLIFNNSGGAGDGVLPPGFVAGGNNVVVAMVQAQKRWLRVLVRNVTPDGGVIYFAYDDMQSLQRQPIGSNVYILPAGQSDVFVLAPQQKLYCATQTETALLTFAVSEALPVDGGPGQPR